LAARVIADRLYPGKAISEMTESEKQTVTTLSLLAGGLAAGTVGDSTTNAVAGAQASQNAVENNYLSVAEADRKKQLELKRDYLKQELTDAEKEELAGINQLDKARDAAIREACPPGSKGTAACGALVGPAEEALKKYGANATYSLLYKDLYPQDAKNVESILHGLDAGSITRDAAITAIAKANNKGWDEVASQYDRAMQLQAVTATLAGFYGTNSVSKSSEATSTTTSMADRIKANIAESQKARESSNFDIHIAKSDQIQWGYKADEWGMVTLPAGSRVYGGIPGQSSYYTSWDTLLDAGFSRESIFKNLQVSPHPEFGYRPQMGIYEITSDIRIPSGQVMANPLLGPGGATQYFIKDYNSQLKLIDKIDLGK
ncbi:VENN motif pre-toxin domain-containing protein, partial [Pectobacterium brasiliense]